MGKLALRQNFGLFVGPTLPQTGKGQLNSLVYFEAGCVLVALGANIALKLREFFAISWFQRESFK